MREQGPQNRTLSHPRICATNPEDGHERAHHIFGKEVDMAWVVLDVHGEWHRW